MRPPRDRNPEKSAAIIAQRSRNMEAGDAADPGRKRQRFSMEPGIGEGQGDAAASVFITEREERSHLLPRHQQFIANDPTVARTPGSNSRTTRLWYLPASLLLTCQCAGGLMRSHSERPPESTSCRERVREIDGF